MPGQDTWEPIEQYADLEDPASGLLNVGRGGFYHLQYRYENQGAAFLAEAKRLTLEVAASCPFGRALGVEGGGEGIVWTPSAGCRVPNVADFWLKTKGEQFFVAARAPKVLVEQAVYRDEQRERARVFARTVCTESRLEQGWQYLVEMGVERGRKGMGAFLGWVTGDIEVEEKREIEEGGFGRVWKGEMTKVAKVWFEESVRGEVAL